MNVYRLDPDVHPSEVGMDAAALDQMAAIFAEAVERSELIGGAQMAVYRNGKRVLEVGGGMARPRLGVPVTPETMFVMFSCTKGLAAVAMWMLHERGLFDFDDPVVKYWPTFASRVPEKATVTIRHVMGHRGGFPTGPAWLTARHWGDPEAIRRAMEEVPLRWTPGEAYGYHALNFGWVVNELIERIDPQGRDTGEFLRDEVFRPLGIANDIFVGLPDDEALEARVAWVERVAQPVSAAQATGVASAEVETPEQVGAGARPARTAAPRELDPGHRETPELSEPFNRPEVHRAVIPAGGGIGTARALAKVYAALTLEDGLDGVRLVSRENLEQAIVPLARPGEVDQTLRIPMRWGTGWHSGGMGEGSSPRTFGHGGMGGQMGLADLDRGVAFAFLTTGQRKAMEYIQWRARLQGMALQAAGA